MDEPSLLAALEANQIRGYVCDFPTPTLNKRPRVVTLPHLGASTNEAGGELRPDGCRRAAPVPRDGTIQNSVNFPDARLPRGEGTRRLAIANSNVPNMVGQIPPCWPRPN